MNSETKKILAIYREDLSQKRGTPIRVRNLLKQLGNRSNVQLFCASQDLHPQVKCEKHLTLGKNNTVNLTRLAKFIHSNKIDIVIYHTISAGYYMPFLFFVRPRANRVLEMHGFLEEEAVIHGDASKIKYITRKFFYYIIYKLSHKITTCSETASKRLKKINKNTFTIYGGVDINIFRKTNLQRELNSNELIIGYSGNARPWQGLSFLLKSFFKVLDKDSGFRLHLLLSEARYKVPDLPEHNKIQLFKPGSQEDVSNFNAGCEILVIPREDNTVNKISFPSKLMEYLAMGIPVVASDTSDVNKVIVHNENGMLFKPGNTKEFINCILKLKDSKLRQKIGNNGLKTASRYSWVNQGEHFSKIILSN